MLVSISAFAQTNFDYELDVKKLTVTNFNGAQNLTLNIEINNKHASVLIIVYEGKGSRPIVVDSSLTKIIPTQGVEKVEIVHRKKFIYRFKKKLREGDETGAKSKKHSKRIKSNRVRVSSGSGGNTTSTTVEST